MSYLSVHAGDTIEAVDTPTVTLSRDSEGQQVLAYLSPDEAARLGVELIAKALKEVGAVDNRPDRTAMVALGYGVEWVAWLPSHRIVDYLK